MRVLITDGDQRAALAAARSLVAAGHVVHVADARRRSLSGVARGVTPHLLGADPLGAPAGYASEVGRLAGALDVGILLPVTDPAVEALLAHRELIPRSVLLPFPDLVTFRAASDKLAMLDLARVAGLDVPETVVLQRRDGTMVPSQAFFPAVLKPHRSVVQGSGPSGAKRKLGVTFVDSPAQCRAAALALPEEAFPVLLQRRVRGAGEGVFLLRWGGRLVAEFAHRRLREKPPAGGVSVYRESIALDAALAGPARRVLEALDWQGVAMVECKRDPAQGRPVFMEVNGRLWGSLQLAIDAGVDFPALLVAAAQGSEPPPPSGYRIGVRSRWWWGDVDHLYLRLRHGGGSRVAAVRDFLRFRRRDREEIWRWNDPAPFLAETLGRLGVLH